MTNQLNIAGYLTTAQAAKRYELTAHRIGCLARAGEIEATTVGHTLLINAESIQLYANANQGRGRPLDAHTAYAALWLLSGLEVDWLSYAQTRRLRIRLIEVSPETLVWQLRKRARIARYRTSDSFLARLNKRLVLSGASCKTDKFDLLGSSGRLEGYCLEADVKNLEGSFHLTADSQGNTYIHVAPWLPEGIAQEMPVAVVAADLAQSLNTRERNAGISMLGRLLDEYRHVQSN